MVRGSEDRAKAGGSDAREDKASQQPMLFPRHFASWFGSISTLASISPSCCYLYDGGNSCEGGSSLAFTLGIGHRAPFFAFRSTSIPTLQPLGF